MVHLTIGKEEIETTLEHLFYVEGEGFVSAGLLEVGDMLETADGEKLPN